MPLPSRSEARRDTVMNEEPEYIEPRTERETRKRHLLIAAVCVVVVMLGLGALLFREMRRSRRGNASAPVAAAQGDSGKISPEMQKIRDALKANPKSVEANRSMADKAEAAGSQTALEWRRRVVELEPGSAENQLALANTAVRFKDIATAKAALEKVSAEEKATVAYHEAAMRVALISRDAKGAEAELVAAVKLEPEKELNQLNLAILRVGSADPRTRAEAIKTIEGFATNPELTRSASRALMNAAIQDKDWRKAIALGQQLRSAKGAIFQDAISYLNLLRQMKRVESGWCLAQLMQESARDAGKIAELMTWMNRNGLSQNALDWSQQIPNALVAKGPVSFATASAAASLGQWALMKTVAENSNWGREEHVRLAMLSRALREEGDEATSRTQWVIAVDTAGSNMQALMELTRLATEWKWEEEATELLWKYGREAPDPLPALGILQRKFMSAGDTRQLRDVAARTLEVRPADLPSRNNFAYYSLLLKEDTERGLEMARGVYKDAPIEPGVIATYAFALHSEGKNDEARKLMRALGERTLQEPGQALCYALILVSSGAGDEARKYFDVARKGNLLPEEKALIPK